MFKSLLFITCILVNTRKESHTNTTMHTSISVTGIQMFTAGTMRCINAVTKEYIRHANNHEWRRNSEPIRRKADMSNRYCRTNHTPRKFPDCMPVAAKDVYHDELGKDVSISIPIDFNAPTPLEAMSDSMDADAITYEPMCVSPNISFMKTI